MIRIRYLSPPALVIILTLVLLLAFGCNRQQNIPPENISRVQVGMTSEQVRQLLGNPAKWKQEGIETEWKYYTSQGKLEVKFQNDRVIRLETH
jgi:outer membrane protein assembly factor BamE (lipoprotein component of BamABCDE complex)